MGSGGRLVQVSMGSAEATARARKRRTRARQKHIAAVSIYGKEDQAGVGLLNILKRRSSRNDNGSGKENRACELHGLSLQPACDCGIEQPKRKCKRSMPITYPGRKRDRLFLRDSEVGCDLTAEGQGLHLRGFLSLPFFFPFYLRFFPFFSFLFVS